MIIRKTLDWRIILRVSWKRLLTLFIIALFVSVAHMLGMIIAISTLPASILGIAIAFLIGFRVNSAYDRWWEARKVWGAIVNDSRTFARQVITMIDARFAPDGNRDQSAAMIRKLIYGQMAFAWALNWNLRGKPVHVEEYAKPCFTDEEWKRLSESKNIPNAILLLQSRRLDEAYRMRLTEDFRHMQMDNTLARLTESMGMAERIKNTVFPRQYAYYSTLFTKVYSYMIPFILVPDTGFMSIPFTLLIGFIFFALDGIAAGIENPFNNSHNDTPMSAIARTIEINLKEMLGETDLPKPIEAVNGFLH